jgi:hypothetical protein
MFDPSVFLDILKNPEQVIATLIGDYEKCGKNREAMDKTLAKLRESPETFTKNPNNMIKLLEGQVVSNRALHDINTRLLLLLIVYCSSSNFASESGMLAVKLGKASGEDVLKEMLRRKMGGN